MSDTDENNVPSPPAEVDPSVWDEAPAVTGRPNDEAPENTTFAERLKQAEESRKRLGRKRVDDDDEAVEDKAVKTSTTKAPRKRA